MLRYQFDMNGFVLQGKHSAAWKLTGLTCYKGVIKTGTLLSSFLQNTQNIYRNQTWEVDHEVPKNRSL